MSIVLLETPCSAPTPEQFYIHRLYALWCARHLFEQGHHVLATHLLCPQWMDDRNPREREFGMGLRPILRERADRVVFGMDLGESRGMKWARDQERAADCEELALPKDTLRKVASCVHPPCTDGYMVGPPVVPLTRDAASAITRGAVAMFMQQRGWSGGYDEDGGHVWHRKSSEPGTIYFPCHGQESYHEYFYDSLRLVDDSAAASEDGIDAWRELNAVNKCLHLFEGKL